MYSTFLPNFTLNLLSGHEKAVDGPFLACICTSGGGPGLEDVYIGGYSILMDG